MKQPMMNLVVPPVGPPGLSMPPIGGYGGGLEMPKLGEPMGLPPMKGLEMPPIGGLAMPPMGGLAMPPTSNDMACEEEDEGDNPFLAGLG